MGRTTRTPRFVACSGVSLPVSSAIEMDGRIATNIIASMLRAKLGHEDRSELARWRCIINLPCAGGRSKSDLRMLSPISLSGLDFCQTVAPLVFDCAPRRVCVSGDLGL